MDPRGRAKICVYIYTHTYPYMYVYIYMVAPLRDAHPLKHCKYRYKRRFFPNPILELFLQIENTSVKHKKELQSKKNEGSNSTVSSISPSTGTNHNNFVLNLILILTIETTIVVVVLLRSLLLTQTLATMEIIKVVIIGFALIPRFIWKKVSTSSNISLVLVMMIHGDSGNSANNSSSNSSNSSPTTINTSFDYDGGNSRISHTDFNNHGSPRGNNPIISITTSSVILSIINHE